MGDENIRVSGPGSTYSGTIGGLLTLSNPLGTRLTKLGIDIYVFGSDGMVDPKASVKRIKEFLEAEGIDPTEKGIAEYLKWLDENREQIALCEKIEKETGIPIFVTKDGVRQPRASVQYLIGFLATVFGIKVEKVKLNEHANSFIAYQKRYFDGITSIAYDQVPTDPKLKDLPGAEKLTLNSKGQELAGLGIDLFVFDGSGLLDEAKSFARIKNFMGVMGIEKKEDFDKFIAFIKDLKGADREKKFSAAKQVLDGRTGASATGLPKYITAPMERMKEVTNFNLLAGKINLGWRLMAVRDEAVSKAMIEKEFPEIADKLDQLFVNPTEDNLRFRGDVTEDTIKGLITDDKKREKLIGLWRPIKEKKAISYYWMDPAGKVSKVAGEDLRVVLGSIIPSVIRGGMWDRAEARDPITVYRSLKGGSLENLLAYQAVLNGVSPETIAALGAVMGGGKTIKDVIDQIKGFKAKVDEAAIEFFKVKVQLDGAKAAAESLAKQTVDSLKAGDSDGAGKRYADYLAAKQAAQSALAAAQAKMKGVEKAEKAAKEALKAVLTELKVNEKDADAIISYLELMQGVWLNAGEVNFENVAKRIRDLPGASGEQIKGTGTLVAVFDNNVVNNLVPKPAVTVGPAAPKGVTVASKAKIGEFIDRPIMLIKAALGGIEGNPYQVDLSTEEINECDLRNIADLFTPRFKIDALSYYTDEAQLKALNTISEKARTYKENSPERIALNKLFEAVKGSEKTFFTREEMKLLEGLLPGFAKDEKDEAKVKIWGELYAKIFSDEGKWRVKQTRNGLDEIDAKKLIEYAEKNPDCRFITLMPEDDDSIETLDVKSILRMVGRQLGDTIKKPKLEGYKDFFNLVMKEIKSSAKVAQEIELPQGVEDQVWMVYRWDHMPKEAQTEFKGALDAARKAKQDLKAFVAGAEKEVANLKGQEEATDKDDKKKPEEKIRGRQEIQKKKEALQKDLQTKKESAQRALENLQRVINRNGLDGRVANTDIDTILKEANLDMIWPFLPALMVDHNGLRLNEAGYKGKEIKTKDDLIEFITDQIGGGGWGSLVRDPGEDIKLSIAKKIISVILSQKYYTRMKQGSMLMAIPAIMPFANTTRLIAMTGLGVAGYTLDKYELGVEPGKALTPSAWMYNVPGLRQMANLTQVVRSEPNLNIASYTHILMVQLGEKDPFYIYEKLTATALGKIDRDGMKLVVKGMGEKVRGLDLYSAGQMEKKLQGKPELTRSYEIYKAYRNGEDVWAKYFEGVVPKEGDFELFVSGKPGKAMMDVVQLGFTILSAEADMMNAVTTTPPGDHIGAAQIENALSKGIAYKPSPVKQTGVISADEAGYEPTEFSGWDVARSALNTTLDFASMQGMFFSLGINYTKNLIAGAEEYAKKGDPTKLLDAAKELAALTAGATLWGIGVNPFAPGVEANPLTWPRSVPYFSDGIQLWKEGQKDKAIGALLVAAKYFIDVMRMNLYRINEARNFLMDRPSQLRAPVTFFNAPGAIFNEVVGRPLKWSINKLWSPEARLSGEGFMSRGLLKLDAGLNRTGVLWDRKWEYLGQLARKGTPDFILKRLDRLSLSPSLEGVWWQKAGGAARTIGFDFFSRGVVGLEFQQRYYNWGSQNRFFGWSIRTEMIMRRQLNSLGDSLKRTGKIVSWLKERKITPDMVAPTKDSIVTAETGAKGAITYKEGNPVALYKYEARIKTLPKSVEVVWEGVKKHSVPVREIKVAAGNDTKVEIFRGVGGMEYARLIVGEDLLKGEGKIDFADAIKALRPAIGTIFDPAEVGEDMKVAKKRVEERTKAISDVWEKYQKGEVKLEDLKEAFDPKGKLPADFDKLSPEDQMKVMERTKVKIGGVEMTYTGVRILWEMAKIGEMAKTVDDVWGKYEKGEVTIEELKAAADPKNKLPADFEKMSHEDQLKVMERTKVKVGGVEISYAEARLAWVRALVFTNSGSGFVKATSFTTIGDGVFDALVREGYIDREGKILDKFTQQEGAFNPKDPLLLKNKAEVFRTLFWGSKIVLTTPQIKGILAMHDGFSAQMYTGEGKTIIRCALDILDAPTGRKMIALTHNDLTAEANYLDTRGIYKAAGIDAVFVRYTDAGLPETFASEKVRVIYLSMNDLAFIDLMNQTSFDKHVKIPYKEGLFRADEFDFIYVDEGLNPYIMSGGEKAKAEVKAWRNARKTVVGLDATSDFKIAEGVIEITKEAVGKPIFINEAGEHVSWNDLSSAQQTRIIRSIEAEGKVKGTDYTVNYLSRDIAVLNTSTGQVKDGATFDNGLQQALQAKHEGLIVGTRITPESSTIAQILSKTLVKKLAHVVASSGTLEPISPILEKVGINFLEIETNVPRYEWDPKLSYEQNLNNIKDLVIKSKAEIRIGGRDLQIRGNVANEDDIKKAIEALKSEKLLLTSYLSHDAEYSPDKNAKVDRIVEKARADINAGRPIIISAGDPLLAQKVVRILRADKAFKGKNIKFLAFGDERLYQRVFGAEIDGPKNKIDILVTTLARRATDIKVKNPKGAILYLIDQEEGSWGEQQKSGRAGRQGTSATIRYFSSPDCAIYSAKLGEANYRYIVGELTGKVDLSGITAESTFKDVLNLLYENKVDPKIIKEFIGKKTKVIISGKEVNLDFMGRAQAGYDEVLFRRWEEGARIEKLLPEPIKQRLDQLREAYGEWTGTTADRKIVLDRAKGIVADEIKFLWEAEGARTELIDLDGDPMRKKGYIDSVQRVVKRLGKMFGVEIQIEIPASGKFSMSDLAERVSKAITDKLFDFGRIDNRELRNIFGQEYLRFEMDLLEATEELVMKYESKGKLLARSEAGEGRPKVRKSFLKEYRIKLDNLLELYRRRIAERVKAERMGKAIPGVGKYSRPVRVVRALGRVIERAFSEGAGAIKLKAADVFVKPSEAKPEVKPEVKPEPKAPPKPEPKPKPEPEHTPGHRIKVRGDRPERPAARPVDRAEPRSPIAEARPADVAGAPAKKVEVGAVNGRILGSGGGYRIPGENKIVFKGEGNTLVVYDFGDIPVTTSPGKIKVGETEYTIEEFKRIFDPKTLSLNNPTAAWKIDNRYLQASLYVNNGSGNVFEAAQRPAAPKPAHMLEPRPPIAEVSPVIAEPAVPAAEPAEPGAKGYTELNRNGIQVVGEPNGALSNISPKNVTTLAQLMAQKKVAYVAFEAGVTLDAKSLAGVSDTLSKLEATAGRRIIIFTTVEGKITPVVVEIPAGAIVQAEKGTYRVIDPKSMQTDPLSYRVKPEPHMIDFFIVVDGKAQKHGGWQSASQLERIYGRESTDRILMMRTEWVRGNWKILFTLAKGLAKVDASLGAEVLSVLDSLGPEQLEKIKPDDIKLLTSDIATYKTKSFDKVKEARVRATLLKLGLSPEKIDERIAEMKYQRIEAKMGTKFVKYLKGREGFDMKKVGDVEAFISDCNRPKSDIAARRRIERLGVIDAKITISLDKAEAVKDELTTYDPTEVLTIRSAEVVKVNVTRNAVNLWIAAEDLIYGKLQEAGLVDDKGESKDPLGKLQMLDAYRQLPASVRKLGAEPLVIETVGGRKAYVTAADGVVTIRLEAFEGKANEVSVTLNTADYSKLIDGRKAFDAIVKAAIAQNRGLDPATVRTQLMNSLEKMRVAAKSGAKNISVELPVLEMTATRTDIENALFKVEVEIDLGGGKKTKCFVTKESLQELLTYKPGTAEYDAALSKIKAEVSAQVAGADNAKVLEQIERQAKLAAISAEARSYFESLAEIEALRTLDAELAKIDPSKMSIPQLRAAQDAALSRARDKYSLVACNANRALMERAATLDMAKLPEAEVRKVFEDVAKKVKVDVDKIPTEKLEAELRTTVDKMNLDPMGKGFNSYMKYFELNAPGGNMRMKAASVGFNSGRMALMGFVLEGLVAIPKYGLSVEALKAMLGSGAGWGKFEAVSRLTQMVRGVRGTSSMGIAIGLTMLWDISLAKPEDRGRVLVVGGVGLSTFMIASKLTGLALKAIPYANKLPGWMQEGIGAGVGIVASTFAGEWVSQNETMQKIATSPVLKGVANGLAAANPTITVYTVGRLGMWVATKYGALGARAAIGVGMRLLGAATAFFSVLLWESDNDLFVGKYYRPKSGARSGGIEWDSKSEADLYTYAIDGGYFCHVTSDTIPYAITSVDPLRGPSPNDPTYFELAILLRQQRFLSDYPDLAEDGIGKKMKELYQIFDGVNFSEKGEEARKKIGKAYSRYRELIGNKNIMDVFTNDLSLAIASFKSSARRAGYVNTDSSLPPELRRSLGEEYVKFAVAEAEGRYKGIEKQAAEQAGKYWEVIAGTNEASVKAAALKAFVREQVAGIRKMFKIASDADALDIYKLAIDDKKTVEQSVEEISGKVGSAANKGAIRAYVEKVRLQRSILLKQTSIQRAIAVKQIWNELGTNGYLAFLKDQGIKPNETWQYVTGNKFKDMYVRFLMERKWRDDQKARVAGILHGTVKVEADEEKSIKAAYENYKKEQRPYALPEDFAEFYATKVWDFNRATVEADARTTASAFSVGGKFMLVVMPAEVRAPFVEFLKKNHPEWNPASNANDKGLPQEMAILLVNGLIRKK